MSKKITLSVALATYNEEKNIKDCLNSIKEIADEIIIVDGKSSDKTVAVCKSFGAKVIEAENNPLFHINKQKAIDRSSGDWVLQLDADERVSPALASEIVRVINMADSELEQYQITLKKKDLFLRHQQLVYERDGAIGDMEGPYRAFFFPRLNLFLGKYLKYGGVYPDGVIRLFKRGSAYLPCKSVHEQMVVNGRVGWLQNDLIHHDSPNFKRYLERNNRYIELIVSELQQKKIPINFRNTLVYMVIKPVSWFLVTQFRHKGVLDGFPGAVFSFFSALRFPRAYFRYINRR